jgi:murein DD-endopeptidase MepM/ murein hydrolase activator NlpD
MPARSQTPEKVFSLPFTSPPGPSTWLMSQQHGNTIGAFNYGKYWYAGGQGLHFGIDFAAPCGTPVVAIADGEIDQVDNMSFGLEPHNLTIFHRELGYIHLYMGI